jgi:hypothetical protein
MQERRRMAQPRRMLAPPNVALDGELNARLTVTEDCPLGSGIVATVKLPEVVPGEKVNVPDDGA